MAAKKRSEPSTNQVGLFAPPSAPIAPPPQYLPKDTAVIIGEPPSHVDLDTFDDYHDSFERSEEADPEPVVTVIKTDKRGMGSFEIVLKRDKYSTSTFSVTRAELQELGLRIEGALK